MTALDQLRVLDERPQPPEPPRRPLFWQSIAIVAVVTLVALIPKIATTMVPSVDTIETDIPPPSLNRNAATSAQLSEAVAIAERLVIAVNSADSEAVIDLLAPSVFGTGLGSSQWPMLYGELGWWGPRDPGAMLNHNAVTDFVRYFRTTPGGVVTRVCDAAAIDARNGIIEVTCTYVAFGGLRALMGQRQAPDQGALTIVVSNGAVADVANRSGINERAWNRIGLWLADVDPDRFEALFQSGDTWTFHPTYTGASALDHAEVAAEYAEAVGGEPLPVG